jgi:hypothetical protein
MLLLRPVLVDTASVPRSRRFAPSTDTFPLHVTSPLSLLFISVPSPGCAPPSHTFALIT